MPHPLLPGGSALNGTEVASSSSSSCAGCWLLASGSRQQSMRHAPTRPLVPCLKEALSPVTTLFCCSRRNSSIEHRTWLPRARSWTRPYFSKCGKRRCGRPVRAPLAVLRHTLTRPSTATCGREPSVVTVTFPIVLSCLTAC